MLRCLLVLIACLVGLSGPFHPVVAQDIASTPATRATAVALLDLPAVALTPADLEAAGHRSYGARVSELLFGPEAMAEAFGGSVPAAEVLLEAHLRAAGLQCYYAS